MDAHPRVAQAARPSGGAGALPTHTITRYLEAAYYLAHEGEVVRPGRLAEWLGVGAPTVSAALQRMRRDRLVVAAADRRVRLSRSGERAAAAIVRRHRVVERWLTDSLGLDWATADAEAGRMAHTLSDAVVERLHRHLGRPTTCPHGNEIPGAGTASPGLVRLTELAPGRTGRIARISELAEHEAPELLRLLDREGLRPGAAVAVARDRPRGGPRTLRVTGRTVELGEAAARAIWVEPDPQADGVGGGRPPGRRTAASAAPGTARVGQAGGGGLAAAAPGLAAPGAAARASEGGSAESRRRRASSARAR